MESKTLMGGQRECQEKEVEAVKLECQELIEKVWLDRGVH